MDDPNTIAHRGSGVEPAGTKSLQHSPRSPARILAAACLLAALAMAALLGGISVSTSYGHNGTRDFVEYWAAGRQLVEGKNPYDIPASWKLEQMAGSRFPVVLMNPPFIMWLVAPLGYLDASSAARAWLIVQLVAFAISVWAIWRLFGRRDAPLIALLSFCFAPILICILIGQIGIFLLLGVALFLVLHEKRPFLAGVVLLPCAMKPHLFLPFGLVISLWMIRRRSYRVLAGLAAGLALSSAVAYWFDPRVWSQWLEYLHLSQPASTAIWNLSRIFRLGFGAQHAWLQFVPVLVASAWAVWYFLKQQDHWRWLDQGLLLLLVSVVCAPYSWFTDEAVLLPCIIAMVRLAQNSGRTMLPVAAMIAAALLQLVTGQWIQTPALVWTAPAWLAYYVYAVRTQKANSAARIAAAV